ncbi:hypothetical protein CEXT_394881 [Caerostris extrusa]|uniref:Uncharacterized protein n=1 Tax=Caerostris extrusa TaxID=172846 RepID=A0AAV4X957_CAEEX|nr:hypothetical protein CEXT_394881 [Caerostris extrusa]
MQNNFNKISFRDHRFTPPQVSTHPHLPSVGALQEIKDPTLSQELSSGFKTSHPSNKLPSPLIKQGGTEMLKESPKEPSAKTPSSHFQIGNEAELSLSMSMILQQKIPSTPSPTPPLGKFEINREKEIESLKQAEKQSPFRTFLRKVCVGLSRFLFFKKKGERFSKLGWNCVELRCFLKWRHVEIA